MKIVYVGCGGIAVNLAEDVARILFNIANKEGNEEVFDIIYVDGDLIEDKNLERQFFPDVVGFSKSEALQAMIEDRWEHPNLRYQSISSFFNEETIRIFTKSWFKAPIIVFSCVDNNATRVFLEEQLCNLKDAILINGGNDETSGQAQVFIRQKGKDLLPRLTELDPEITVNEGGIPEDGHCLENGVSEPQTALVNKAVATAMLMLFRKVFPLGGPPEINEIRIDIDAGKMSPFLRKSVRELMK